MNINSVKNLSELVVNKNNGLWSVTRFNTAVQSASLTFFNDCFGEPQQSRNGVTANDMVWQSGEKLSNNLRLLVKPVILQVNAQGKAVRPTDYVQASSVRYFSDDKEVNVKFVRDGNLSSYLDSDLLAPNHDYPIYATFENYLQFYPKDLSRVQFTYLRQPAVPVWGYTMQGTPSRPVYDAATSVDVDFPDECINEIVSRVVALFGINIREKMIVDFAQQQQNQGS